VKYKGKLALVASYAPSLINFRGKLIEAAISDGWDVIVLAPDFDAETLEKVRRLGAKPCSYVLQRTGMNPFSDLSALWSIYKVFKHECPSVVLSYTIKPVLYASLAAYAAKTRGVYSMITGLGFSFSGAGWKQRLASKVTLILFKRALLYNQKVFFQNPDDRKLFEEKQLLQKEKSVLINGSGVDTTYFSPVPLPNQPRFLMIARLLREKGIYEYIEAARLVKQRYPDITFNLAGWVDEGSTSVKEQRLDEWINEGVIHFLGKLDDVRPALAECSVYVLPSYREGTPRTVLEAMAMGRAIITTDVPGCRETIVDGKEGLLVEAKNIEALSSAMMRVVENYALVADMGRRSRARAEEKYDVNHVNQSILKTLDAKVD